MWVHDAAGVTTYFNRKWTEYTGLDPEANANNGATTANVLTQAVTPSLQRLVATLSIAW